VAFPELNGSAIDWGVVVVDVRPAEVYAAGHIAGARSIPIHELKARPRVLLQMCRGGLMMRKTRPLLFRGRHFEDQIIILCVRWYLGYALSYRDLRELRRRADSPPA
jgi:rhodanese-related sulfurtransferase